MRHKWNDTTKSFCYCNTLKRTQKNSTVFVFVKHVNEMVVRGEVSVYVGDLNVVVVRDFYLRLVWDHRYYWLEVISMWKICLLVYVDDVNDVNDDDEQQVTMSMIPELSRMNWKIGSNFDYGLK